ncbi:13692_t:CDS:1, partial [Acaulospora colombiana]
MSSRSLKDLPEETVLQIVKHLHTDSIIHKTPEAPIRVDLLQLALCSKRYQRITLPFLYHTIHFTGLKVVERFLNTILEYPTYAPLVKAFDCYGQQQMKPKPELHGIDFSRIAEIQKLAPDLIQSIKERQEWTYVILLPFLLQNLEELDIEIDLYPYMRDFGHYFSQMLDKGLVFRKLRSISWGFALNLGMNLLSSTFLLPSITRVCIDGWIEFEDTVACHYGTSSVEDLELRVLTTSEKDMNILLRLPRALKKFTWSPTYWEDVAGPILLQGCRRALECVSRSLEFLYFRWRNGFEHFPPGLEIWSLDNFVSLKTLCINYQLICGRGPNLVLCISNSLPKSLEILVMHSCYEGP